MRKIRVAFLGFGNVGKAVSRMIIGQQRKLKEKYGTEIAVTAVATASKGNLYCPEGIDLKQAIDDAEAGARFSETEHITGMSAMEIAENGEYDILVELTPLDIRTGQPAADHIRAALKRGRHAVTANKGPVAWCFRELKTLAEENKVKFLYETVVMDGTPLFSMTENCLPGAEILGVSGILNTTTNYILEEMGKGVPMDEIMKSGRAMGFVEADPSLDTEGWDGAVKITSLINVLMDGEFTPDRVKRQGIDGITYDHVADAKARGKKIKVLCRGWRDSSGMICAEVKPVEVPVTDILATVSGTTSLVTLTTDLMGRITIVEEEPEIQQTAYGVFSDILRAAGV